MSDIIVTLKTNVEQDEDGQIILSEEGIPKLLDPEDIGILVKSHVILTASLAKDDAGDTNFDSGYTTRAEVYWDKRRSPSPAMHKPTDLVWMEFMSEDQDDDDGGEEETEITPNDDSGQETDERELEMVE